MSISIICACVSLVAAGAALAPALETFLELLHQEKHGIQYRSFESNRGTPYCRLYEARLDKAAA